MDQSNNYILIAAAILAADRLPQVPLEESDANDAHVDRVVVWSAEIAVQLAAEVENIRGSAS